MRRKECTICYQDFPANQFPLLPHKQSHKHDQSVCSSCWHDYLSATIKSSRWDAVICAECDEKLRDLDIKKLALRETYHE